MEDSKQTFSSSNNNQRTDCPEESGWTSYFDDYFTNNNREFSSNTDCFSDFGSSSLVSDAASGTHVGLKFSENMERSTSRQISFKKRRTRDVVAFDDALEDTASSPVNSPKVSDLKRQVYVNPRKKDGNIDSSQGKNNTSVHCTEFQTDKNINELGPFGRENEFTQLKKRGLCLVPLSMLVNYIG
ncbi:hypothetical protein AQUCO_04700076v1 [Aquilegia coerulea]|uniref:Uncharacterized protein n=1 Tax=Aquilegia coerulea TaxID=218851 RepID=A0A2G5CKV1_AQUCA|nr:hypothetical protein AQUCO_04700076v1 [Aquilegia coerulea]